MGNQLTAMMRTMKGDEGTNGNNFEEMIALYTEKYQNDQASEEIRWRELKTIVREMLTTGAATMPELDTDAYYQLNARSCLPTFLASDFKDHVNKE